MCAEYSIFWGQRAKQGDKEETAIMQDKNSESKAEMQAYIEAAVEAAYAAGIQGVEKKVQEAVNLGIAIGVQIGAEICAKAGAEAGAAAAVKAIEKERKKAKKQQYDWRYRNTKLLLRHYRALNDHYKHAIFDKERAAEEYESFTDIMEAMNVNISDEALYIESIKRSCARTKIIMSHVNKMLECYEIMCSKSRRKSDARRWRIIDGIYISDIAMTAEELAKQEGVDKRTVYRDVDLCISDLTVLFFGIEGIEGL